MSKIFIKERCLPKKYEKYFCSHVEYVVAMSFTGKQHFDCKTVKKCSRQFSLVKCTVEELRENYQRLKCKCQSISSIVV